MGPWWPLHLMQEFTRAEASGEGCSADDLPLNRRWWQATQKMNSDEYNLMIKGAVDQINIEGQVEGINILSWSQEENKPKLSMVPGRSSPPLYEVELTASDEDDDNSVLELVIPMTSRYQRVPTSSPKKGKPKKTSRYFCNLFCCVRK